MEPGARGACGRWGGAVVRGLVISWILFSIYVSLAHTAGPTYDTILAVSLYTMMTLGGHLLYVLVTMFNKLNK